MAKKPLIILLSLAVCGALLAMPALADNEAGSKTKAKTPEPAEELVLQDSMFYVTDHSVYFADVTEKHAWAVGPIDYLANTKTVSGTGNCLFSPDDSIRRADFLLMLYRAYDMSLYVSEENFEDVSPDTYYADALSACRTIGIATADASNKFFPTDALTRQDAMVFLYRTLERTGLHLPAGDLSAFSDASEIADYAVQPVSALVRAGVISGSDGKINPTAPVSRASMSVMLYRALMITVENNEAAFVARDDRMNICIGSSIYPNIIIRNLPESDFGPGLYELAALYKTENGYEVEMGVSVPFDDEIGFQDGMLTVNGEIVETTADYESVAVDVYGHLDGLYATGSEYSSAAALMHDGALSTIYYKK
ncbi:MAG: S-layer homology domain-containing protein [Butyricicoccus sp.]|nr:S-layer homology domain-containing protein [Butyricicoccus sp.]MBQ8585651.1 S-layer homology domain-containing protein [Butyricicoccus sp.]